MSSPEGRLQVAVLGKESDAVVSVYAGDIIDCGGKSDVKRPGETIETNVSDIKALINKGKKSRDTKAKAAEVKTEAASKPKATIHKEPI
jgi:hypothetical protein